MMRSRYAVLPFFLLIPGLLCAQWQQVTSIEGGSVADLEQVGDEIWAATPGGLYISQDEGSTWERDTYFDGTWHVSGISVVDGEVILPVYKDEHTQDSDFWSLHLFRTKDQGASWLSQQVRTDINQPRNGSEVFLMQGELFYENGYEFLHSSDDGQSWSEVKVFENGYIGIPFHYASSEHNLLVLTHYGLYLSRDKGSHWEFLDSVISTKPLVFQDSLIIACSYDDIRVSYDLGSTWESRDLPEYLSYGILERGPSGTLYALEYRNNYISKDDGITWKQLTPDNIGQPTHVLEIGEEELLLSSSSGCYHIDDHGKASKRNEGLILSNVIVTYTSPYGERLAGTGIGPFKSHDDGLSWTEWITTPLRTGYPSEIKWLSPDSAILMGFDGHFLATGDFTEYDTLTAISQFSGPDQCVAIEDTLFVPHSDWIWRSKDLSLTWQKIYVGADELQSLHLKDGVVFVASDRAVLRSMNGGVDWEEVYDFSLPGAQRVQLTSVQNRLILCTTYDWRYSDDNGQAWVIKDPIGLPFYDRAEIEFVEAENVLFAFMTGYGVFISDNKGETWEPFNDGLYSRQVKSVTYGNKVLLLGTANAGLWTRDVSGIVSVQQQYSTAGLNMYPNPSRRELSIEIPHGVSGELVLHVFSVTGHLQYQARVNPGSGDILTINPNLQAGLYAVILSGGDQQFIGKVAVLD